MDIGRKLMIRKYQVATNTRPAFNCSLKIKKKKQKKTLNQLAYSRINLIASLIEILSVNFVMSFFQMLSKLLD